ncbi:PhzF family phenazine biosynthesis protein [Neoaquamicrobium sediminum]|uniref:PhzF family phenazine biosynthesis protein n=1 Tax=Neoaquamicrobium sediminum TaxID=1849104 RepID=UPI003BA9C0DF
MTLQSHAGALPAGLIDVFADAPLTGNPLAVVEDADALTEAQMRPIAGEFNQAETTFVMRSDRADRKLRSFRAAGAEVGGAGHNALGAWLWLAEEGRLGSLDTPRTFHQEIAGEVLPIVLEKIDGRIFGRMRQSRLNLFSPLDKPAALASALQLQAEDILVEPRPRVAGTGAAHLLVRVRDRTVVDRAKPSAEALLGVLASSGGEGCYIYAFDPASPDQAYARFFNPTVGLWEDAATGTAAGPLAAYLAREGLIGETIEVEQGTKMGRRSILRLRLVPDPELSGAGVVVMRGGLFI